jgi:hypothetical protein
MVDYIAREAVRQALRDPIARGFHFTEYELDKIPMADVKLIRHARWDKPSEHGLPYKANRLGVVCSECCSWSNNKYTYCPDCGARMDGGSNG